MLKSDSLDLGTIGSRLQAARKKAGLTQKEVAEKLGIPKYQTISAYETNTNSPPYDTLKDLCRLYGVTSDFILFGSEKSVIKSVKDYLIQFVEATDFFQFPIRKAVRDVIPRNGQYSSSTQKNVYTVDMDPSTTLSTDDFDRFLARWHDLRNVLDNDTIGQDTYEIVLAQKMEQLEEGVFSDLMPF